MLVGETVTKKAIVMLIFGSEVAVSLSIMKSTRSNS